MKTQQSQTFFRRSQFTNKTSPTFSRQEKNESLKVQVALACKKKMPSVQLSSIVHTVLLLHHSDLSKERATGCFCSVLFLFCPNSLENASERHKSQFHSFPKIFHYTKFHNLLLPISVMQRKTNFPSDSLLKLNVHSKHIF